MKKTTLFGRLIITGALTLSLLSGNAAVVSAAGTAGCGSVKIICSPAGCNSPGSVTGNYAGAGSDSSNSKQKNNTASKKAGCTPDYKSLPGRYHINCNLSPEQLRKNYPEIYAYLEKCGVKLNTKDSSNSCPTDDCTDNSCGQKTDLSNDPVTDSGTSDSSADQEVGQTDSDTADTVKTDTADPDTADITKTDTAASNTANTEKTDAADSDTTDTGKTDTTDSDASEKSDYAEQILKLVNAERQKAGLSPVAADEHLTAAANIRAKEIAGYFSHTRPDGRSFYTVLSDNSISYQTCGENIAYGQKDADEVMTGWMNSSGHRANILHASFDRLGVGYYRDANGRNHWVQIFTN